MNLPQFLKRVDKELASMSHEDLKVFAHEIARTYPEDSRERFLQILTSKSKPKKNASLDDLNRIRQAFAEINSGYRCLDSDDNPEAYDNYYNEDDYDNYRFYDSDKLLPEIEFAIKFIHKCIDSESYKDGYEVVKMLYDLEIRVNGAYYDVHDENLTFMDLFYYNILKNSFNDFMNEVMFLTYMNHELSERPEAMYSMITHFNYDKFKLENVMQLGNKDLPEINDFLSLWLNYLAGIDDDVTGLLLNAYSLLDNEEQQLQLADEFATKYPELYKRLLEESSADNEIKIQIGLKALKAIPISKHIRSKIALLTAKYAIDSMDQPNIELCCFEAFKSDPTFSNYMRAKFSVLDWSKYASEVSRICKTNLSKSIDDFQDYSEQSKQKDYRGILFFECDFDFVIEDCMKIKSPLDWAETFMKEALFLFLLLLFEGEKLSRSLIEILSKVIDSLGFTSNLYPASMVSDSKNETFWNLFQKWKKGLNISEKKREEWLRWLEDRINFRTIGLLEAKKYNRYSESAMLISALGDVQASRGDKNFKLRKMVSYMEKYPTRKAFIRELDAYRS